MSPEERERIRVSALEAVRLLQKIRTEHGEEAYERCANEFIAGAGAELARLVPVQKLDAAFDFLDALRKLVDQTEP